MSSLTPLIDEGLSSIPGIFCVHMCDGVLSLNQSAVKKKKEFASTTAVVIQIVVLVDLKKFQISILPEF
jgi:hypothetical protein